MGRGAELASRRRPLRRQPGPRHYRVARIALVLVEAAHVPAVVELDDAPFVAVPARAHVLVHGEVVGRPLAIDPPDGAGDVLRVIPPGQPPAHVEAALEVGEGARRTEEHHLAAQQAAAERRRRPAGLDGQLEQHASAVVIHTGQRDVPRERHQRSARVPALLPAGRPRRAVEA